MIKKTKEIKDKNDLLGFIINNVNSNNDFNIDILIKEFGVEKLLDFQKMIYSLQDDNCLIVISTDVIHLYPEANQKYISPQKKIWLKAKPFITHFFSAIFGAILSNLKEFFDFFTDLFSKLFQ